MRQIETATRTLEQERSVERAMLKRAKRQAESLAREIKNFSGTEGMLAREGIASPHLLDNLSVAKSKMALGEQWRRSARERLESVEREQ